MQWGDETSEELAVSLSNELNLELKAIEYVKAHVQNFLINMRKELRQENISEDHLEQILVEGHRYAMEELGVTRYSNMRERMYSKYIDNQNK
jgi:L-lactate utilization protein LutC